MKIDYADEELAEDQSHPIPKVDVIDVWGERKGGGADLVVIIASPMDADARSKKRLIAKVHGYLGYLASAEFKAKCGEPTPSTTRIIVQIHEDSDFRTFEFIEECRGWIEDNKARLEIQKI